MALASDPLQVLTPPRVAEEVSGKIGELAPAGLNEYARVWKAAVPPTAFNEYARDFWQRSVLFLDILRQRGNQREDMLAHGAASVLSYDSELVMRATSYLIRSTIRYCVSFRRKAPRSTTVNDRSWS